MNVYCDGWVAHTMDLADFLKAKVDETSLRDVAGKTEVSKTAIDNIIKRRTGDFPEIGTLERIAKAYSMELWEVMIMAGVKLGLPENDTERSRRLAALVARRPALEHLVERLYAKMDTNPGFVDGMIMGIETTLDRQDGLSE
jgi:transcriptional regulator with XRE-family HTH domain